MSTKVAQHRISITMNSRRFAGLMENSLLIKPNFEPVLLHANDGRLTDELINFTAEMSLSGLMYVKEVSEALSHYDFTDLRQAVAAGAPVTFMHGEIGSVVSGVSGQAKIVEYSETAGSQKTAGAWSLKMRADIGEAPVIVYLKAGDAGSFTFDSTLLTIDDDTLTMDEG